MPARAPLSKRAKISASSECHFSSHCSSAGEQSQRGFPRAVGILNGERPANSAYFCGDRFMPAACLACIFAPSQLEFPKQERYGARRLGCRAGPKKDPGGPEPSSQPRAAQGHLIQRLDVGPATTETDSDLCSSCASEKSRSCPSSATGTPCGGHDFNVLRLSRCLGGAAQTGPQPHLLSTKQIHLQSTKQRGRAHDACRFGSTSPDARDSIS